MEPSAAAVASGHAFRRYPSRRAAASAAIISALSALGYGIDPFSILVPFLVFAIGVSHGVQKICTFRNEMFKGQDGPTAARVLARLEDKLNGQVAEEVKSFMPTASAGLVSG